ncbi:DUF4232 domain-containing protein [Streptomyces sp. SID5910]|uniref:DUF4232 domain-containing protein n=1 Tax=Streptomyces sp. SID5910 TaxID=2690312 RepID=UPI00136F19A6|nr:DUF4232 domain-containing protein [Streptomyces sp. SID5910]MYR45778.1 DUF4232 domain-containing protein [Streptomyces sp. SID5910]
MRTTKPAVAAMVAVTAALLLTACGSGGDDGGSADSGGGKSGTADRGPAACRIGETDVEIAPSPAPAAGDTGTVAVTLANHGPACTLDGFPAVTLTADGTPAEVPADEAATAQRLTLTADGTATFTLTYVRGDADGLAVRSAEFALPGDAATHRFAWSYGEVAKKGGAPDATVSAFQRAGD